MRKPFTKQLGCVALALVLLIAFLPSTVNATTPCTGQHKPDLTTLYPADWNDQTGGYGYDYYKCIDCGEACDKDGNPHMYVGPGNGCSGGEKKHVPDLSNEYSADFTPCYGGYNVAYYHCIACGAVVDNVGTRLNADPPTKLTHTPGAEEFPANYTSCNGGFQSNFYICVDCGTAVDVNGAPLQWVAGNGSHTRGSELHDPDFLPCRGGINQQFYICTVCDCPVDANGDPIQPLEPTASHVPGELHDPDFPCQPGYHQQYQICTVCECGLDVNGNQIQGEEPTESHVLSSESFPSNYTSCGGGFQQSYYVCTKCGWPVDAKGNLMEWVDGDGNHNIEVVPRLEPTSDSYGYIAHWRCTRCDMRFLDAAGNNPVEDEEQILLPPLTPSQPEEQTRVESSALQAVPETVAAQYPTVESVQNVLTEAASAPADANAATVYLDVVLQTQNDDGEWVPIAPEDFPAEGLDVTLPYPEGTGMNGYTFIVTHMITHGEHAGEVETLTANPQQDGIHVHVTSLSPVAITYWASEPSNKQGVSGCVFYPNYPDNDADETSTIPAEVQTSAAGERSPQTGDTAAIALWTMLLLSGAAMLFCLINKKRA